MAFPGLSKLLPVFACAMIVFCGAYIGITGDLSDSDQNRKLPRYDVEGETDLEGNFFISFASRSIG